MHIFLVILGILVATVTVAHSQQIDPGTSTRPILSVDEADTLTEEIYLQGWSPDTISLPSSPDYTVGIDETYTSIQKAVNAAINTGSKTRLYILIQPGTYAETVFIAGKVPLTIYGGGSSPSDVKILLNQSADMTVAAWIQQVNPNGSRYNSTDPAYSIYNGCASRNSTTIGTSCTSIFWIKSSNIQVVNLEVENSSNKAGDDQAVALKTNADLIQLDNLSLISRQDTLYAGSGGTKAERVYISNTYIEGDVDFVFGGASTIFNNCIFNAVSDRHPSSGIVFAPNTPANNSYGYLIINSHITGDSTFLSTKVVSLGRGWDSNVPTGTYVPGTSPNGQIVIRSTQIDGIINVNAPWTTSTSSRIYSGNNSTDRDLNDNNYNRFWEYDNTGDGA